MRNWRCICLALVGVLVLACRETNEGGSTVTVDDLGPVVERHAEELMRLPGVTGVAAGALADGTPCILILVLEDTRDVRSRLPAEVEGHPVQIMVTGEIEPFTPDSSG